MPFWKSHAPRGPIIRFVHNNVWKSFRDVTVSPVRPSLRKGVRGPYKLSLSGSQGGMYSSSLARKCGTVCNNSKRGTV